MLYLQIKHKSLGIAGVPAYTEVDSVSTQLYAFAFNSLHIVDNKGEPICRLEVEYKIKKEPKCQNKS